MRLLHLAQKQRDDRTWTPPFLAALQELGEVTVVEHTGDWTDEAVAEFARGHDVAIVHWGARRLPEELAERPGRLRYICNLSGETRPFAARVFVERGLAVTNWGDLPAASVAEGALALLLTSLKQVVPQQLAVRRSEHDPSVQSWRGSVRDLVVGVYGLGVIGQAFAELVRPLRPQLIGFDPFVSNWPDGVRRVDTLDDLFASAQAVVITAALTDETRHTVDSSQLARLPEGAVVVNVARGGIIRQDDLFAELACGRLRAALDVLDTDGADKIPSGHPARQWPNLLLTEHHISNSRYNQRFRPADCLTEHQELCLANLHRFVAGEPLRHRFDLTRYDRST